MKIINVIKHPGAYLKIALLKANNLVRVVFMTGDRVCCQICGWKGNTFYKQKCPKCNSLPRTRLVPFSINYFNLLDSKSKILHIAPNVNEYQYLKRYVIDASHYDRLNIRKVPHINIVQDLRKTNLPIEHYNLAIAWHVLEHIPEDILAIEEVYRLLKPGGHFLVSVPVYPKHNPKTYEDTSIAYKDFENSHGHYDHCRSCGLDYYERFETIGFKTQTLEVSSLSEHDIAYFGLRKDHVVWCFRKE